MAVATAATAVPTMMRMYAQPRLQLPSSKGPSVSQKVLMTGSPIPAGNRMSPTTNVITGVCVCVWQGRKNVMTVLVISNSKKP